MFSYIHYTPIWRDVNRKTMEKNGGIAWDGMENKERFVIMDRTNRHAAGGLTGKVL